METNRRYRYVAVEACDIYKAEQENGNEIGLKLPDKNAKNNYDESNNVFDDSLNISEIKVKNYYDYFNNVFDDSLELRQLEKIYIKYCRKKFYFEDEYSNKYTMAVINVKFKLTAKTKDKRTIKNCKELRDYFYNNGFNCEGIHYVRYKRSSGSSREGKCLFIDERLYKPMAKWGECGIKEPSNNFASWESYKALSLSSIIGTIKIPLNGILFIKDYKSIFNDDVIEVAFNNDTKKIESKKNNIEITNNIWDGESLLDESLFKGEYKDKHMLLLRNKFFKSCAFKTRLQKWFKDKKIDIEKLKNFGFVTFASDISQIVMVTTESSMKFLKFKKKGFTKENIKNWADNVDEEFGVVKCDEPTKLFDGRMVRCSYQFINTLGLSKEDVNQLLKPSNDFLDAIRKDYDFMLFYLSEQYKKRGDNNKNNNSDEVNDRSDVIRKLLHINYDFKDTMLYNNFLNDIVEAYKNELKQGHILLSGTNATLFGNGPEMLYALSGEFELNNNNNESMSLKPGEILCDFFKNGEEVVCYRSPHITMGNLYCVKNNLNGDIWKYFDLGNNVVGVNAIKENIQQRLNGCDYDSDTILITNDKLIVDVANRNKELFGVPTCSIKQDDIIQNEYSISDVDYKISENKIGEIVNTSQILNSILWDNINNNSNYNIDDTYNNICTLAVLSGIEIDKAKKEYGAEKLEQMKSLLDDLEGECKERPNFFEDIDEEKRESYANYDTAMNYVYDYAKGIDYRNGKPFRKEYKEIIDMIKKPNDNKSSTAYYHRDQVLKKCEEYNKTLEYLYKKIKDSDEDERDVLYEKINQLKYEYKTDINNLLTSEYDIYLVLKELKAKKKYNWHFYSIILDNEIFKKMLYKSKEKMNKLIEDKNGSYEIFGIKYTKI